MDSAGFDSLTRTLMIGHSRRGALAALLGGPLGLLGLADATGKKGKGKRGPSKNKQRKRKNTRPVAAAAPGPPAPTCADGVTNGRESDVDCGGTCPRCANGRTCVSQDDCASALCVSGVCQECRVFEGDCGIDAAGPCQCHTHNIQEQPHVCVSRVPGETREDCGHCPDDTFCVRTGPGDYTCYQPCGAV